MAAGISRLGLTPITLTPQEENEAKQSLTNVISVLATITNALNILRAGQLLFAAKIPARVTFYLLEKDANLRGKAARLQGIYGGVLFFEGAAGTKGFVQRYSEETGISLVEARREIHKLINPPQSKI